MQTERLEEEIKVLITETLALEDIKPEEIDSHAPLFGDGLGLDSIDALELGITLQKHYGVKMEGSADENRQHFASVVTLAAFVAARVGERLET